MTETERMYAYFICSIPMIGGVRAGQLLSRFGDPQGVYEAGTAGWREILNDSVVEYMDRQKKSGNLEEEYHSLGEKQIGLVLQEEEGFPQKLLEIPDPPYGLFYKGKLPEQKQPSVAVIGARECSEYGRFVAEELGRYLGSQGIQVISGMARGIDGISQQAALLAGGTSYGVLGCGVDICYPSQNRKLYEELIQKGGLLSTYAPGTKALPAYFPPRNRIVSGLADALIVIEARQKSGTLITVDMALEQGKNVYAVPGRITDRLSDGCNMLLRQGAGIALSPEDFLAEVSLLYGRNSFEWEGRREKSRGKRNEKKKDGRAEGEQTGEAADIIDEGEKRVLSLLDVTPKSLDELLAELKRQGQELGLSELTSKLILLCLKGEAVQIGGSYGIRQK